MTAGDDSEETGRSLPDAMRDRLWEALRRKEWSIRDLSRIVLIGESTLGAIFNGKQDTKVATLFRIIDTLGANPGYVVAGMLPKWIEDVDSGESGIMAAVSSDADRWLRAQPPGAVSPAEAEHIRSAPLPEGSAEQRDAAYATLLNALRYAATLCRPQ